MKPLLLFYNRPSLFLFFFVLSCTLKQKDNIQCDNLSTINPNGSSEMALFMRDLSKKCDTNKVRLKNNQPISFNISADKILTAKMTKGHHMDSTYKAFALQFIDQIKAINNEKSIERQAFFYNAMIQNCTSCHQNRCPGPITKIKKLYVK